MKNTGLLVLFVLIAALAIIPSTSQAQTVSIIKATDDTSSMMVETALKRFLRAEGYTVKGEVGEGFTVWLQVMKTKNVGGQDTGLAGSVIIGSFQWQRYADTMVSDGCKAEHQLADNVATVIGTTNIYIASTLAPASNSDDLGELFSTFINTKVRAASMKAATFMEEVEKRRKQTGTAPSRQYQ